MGKYELELSNNLMQMQFMRPAKIALEERRKKENLQKIEDEHFDVGYSHLQKLRFGRFSFNGANVEVEKLMKFEERQKKHENDPNYESDNEKEVGDEEMANSAFGRRFQQPTQATLQIYTEESTSTAPVEEGKVDEATKFAAITRDKKRFEPYRRGRGGYRPRFKKK